ncbi:MAG: hypothetical protein IPJ89_04675 [Candidatus Iainarchaeum archaeon]|uniref:Uncharacterized protein n=1 Tax=Candidatus Iainarchaeum sp. TaxID=3101447 RepID=A0A7T9I0Y6_9ARCH|nr:MAG: hypothetical protein IPJ89_04675 [Candidatus Diapherotrites archaeon]
MPLFNDATWFLLGIALVLIVLNFVVHRWKRNSGETVRVAFIPPRTTGENASPELASKLDAHVSATNQKLSQLHERLVAVENALLRLQDFFTETKSVAAELTPAEIEIIDSPAVVHARTASRARKK